MSGAQSLKRLRYSLGQVLTAEDFQLEQRYFREKLKLHNRSLHGFGIVNGLKVTIDSGQIVVEPGLALDCEGNELLIDAAQSIVPPDAFDSVAAYLNVRYVEVAADPVPCTERVEPVTIAESFELTVALENSNRGHRHLRARWLACGQPHALTLAKLRRGGQGWRVERGYRPPSTK